MKADFRHCLLTAFERGIVAPPATGERWAMFNGQVLPEPALSEAGLAPAAFRDALFCEQGFRPLHLDLVQAGFRAEPRLAADAVFDGAILFAARARAANELSFRRAWQQVRPGGRIILCGDRKAGADGMRKWLSAGFGAIDSFSKHHAICLEIARRDCDLPASLQAAGEDPGRAGLFSADGADPGSQLLAAQFKGRVRGHVADFGAGWGYLAQRALSACDQIKTIDLYEADFAALEAARTFLDESGAVAVNYHWIDLTREFRRKPYDTVIMNPPFHLGHVGDRRARPETGQAFIRLAASTLVSGGRLLMVANRQLPYEGVLDTAFRRVEKLAEQDGFKVYEAVR
ncbi:MAG: class I SAM-dependent methyltransferase [Nitratireductor sp.]|nr:class I SAM-dependent methyltransferase [Nitratireductor sp.]